MAENKDGKKNEVKNGWKFEKINSIRVNLKKKQSEKIKETIKKRETSDKNMAKILRKKWIKLKEKLILKNP